MGSRSSRVKVAEKASDKAVGIATGLQAPIRPESGTMECTGLVSLIRGYVGDRLVFVDVFKTLAE
jgi:hypothetical protein